MMHKMLNTIIHENEITLWWDKGQSIDHTPVYTVVLNEKERYTTAKTQTFEIKNVKNLVFNNLNFD